MTPLDPLALPLQGLSLIEASAGTGKTYTITTLYLRLLLEGSCEVDRILVVTYTQAATEELRDRVRRRLVQALEWLRAGDLQDRRAQDPALADLLLRLADPQAATTTLADTLTRMDEAAIYTIHGFCQRCLQDHAFESGTPFETDLITDEEPLRARAVHDFWRARVSPAPRERAAWVRARWRDPHALLAELAPHLTQEDPRLLPDLGEASPSAARRDLEQCFNDLCDSWRKQGQEVRAILEADQALNRRSYNKRLVAKALAAAERLVSERSPPTELPEGFERLTNECLAAGTKPGTQAPTHPFFDLCDRYAGLLSRIDALESAHFLADARDLVREHLDRRKRDEGLLYFDDLLNRLDGALQGPGAEGLARAIRRRYPVALIDEFQDTDPQQYRIFRRVYQGQADCGLFLIGDPKQAIYGFRGADIFTYMQARRDAEGSGRQFTLGVNWRSGSRLIQALNALYRGAVRPFIQEPHIRFQPVAPSPSADERSLLLDGEEPPALQFWMLRIHDSNQTKRPPGFIRRDMAQAQAASGCAERIAELLERADRGAARLGDMPLQAKDIAVLVRTHREGELIQQALRDCRVGSVSLSQDSVFSTEDAGELETLLAAMVEPNDEALVRTALASGLLGRRADELERLGRDELAWEQILARFQGYRARWLEQGPMVAFQSILVEEEIGARLLRRPDGERRLTNLLQLVELIQVASREQPGPDGLMRWLADQRADGQRDEARQLRLESDEGLVKVVTMHKSKGLEYPLVFIPFPWSYFQPPRTPALVRFHDPVNLAACLDLGSEDQARHRQLEQTEQLAERLRLFYVAVTRAAKLCVLCWGRVKGAEGSALAYLLHPDPASTTPASRLADLTEEEIRADLDALADRLPAAIQIRDLPTPSGIRRPAQVPEPTGLAAAHFAGTIDTRWRVTSYSALLRGEEPERPDHDGATATAAPEAEPDDAPMDPVFALPAGIQAGYLLHALFEQLDFPAASGPALETRVRTLLERYGQLRTSSRPLAGPAPDWTPHLLELATQVLDTHLDAGATLRLRDIGWGDRLTELEFHFPLTHLDPAGLRSLLAGFEDYRGTADGLTFEPLRGLMRGFIDLVFRHAGRFYLLDYKSNHLGNRLADYAPAALHRAMRQHRYDLQYLIYSLALHRFLGQRVPDYAYERHFGGVYYLFLRGMRPDQGPRYGVWQARPEERLIAELDRHLVGRRDLT